MPTPAPTVTPASVQWTFDAYMKMPRLISRELTDLAAQEFVADQLMVQAGDDAIQGGSVAYQKSESIYLDATRDFEEIGPRSKFPRGAWSEDLYTAFAHQYGFEIPFGYLTLRRTSRDVVSRALVKLANTLVKYVDTKMFAVLNAEVTAGNVQTTTATASWTGGSQKILADFAKARLLIDKADQGYSMDAVVLSTDDMATLATDPGILSVLGREGADNQASSGEVSRILGIRKFVSSNRLAQGTAWFLDSRQAASIADEQPAAEEGFVAYDPGAGKKAIWVRTYDDVDNSQRVIRAMRTPAMWVPEPKAIVKMTGL